MANEPTLTPNSGGWNCTSADGKICVYGRTQEEAKMRCKMAQLVQLPPYDVTAEEQASADYVMLTDMEKLLAARLVCRERQLLEAIGQLAAEKRHSTTWRHHARQWRRIARGYYADHKPNPIFGIDSCPCDVCARYRAFVESPEAAKRAALALGGESQKEG